MEDIKILAEKLKKYNDAYRSGHPLISDHEYDELLERLRKLDPCNAFLQRVEPEKFAKRQVRHPVAMLSTEKAYSREDIERFIVRVKKEALQIGITDLLFKVTPKLDGLAGRDDGKIFVTRGNGEIGFDISNAFTKGVIPIGGRGLGLGEIVILKSYFEKHLADKFEHPRNMVVGIISSDSLNDFAKMAIEDEAVHFVPYSKLSSWYGSAEELLKNIKNISKDLIRKTDYSTDGVVAEVTSSDVRNHMGSTAHHYRWQIAIKEKGETARTTVEKIEWQVGRTGNVTPVLIIYPVYLSGATIKRVTGHNAGLVQRNRIGIGAEIEVIRSGEVIPKLEKVIKETDHFFIPENCPACGTLLEWNNDFLKCHNPSCKAQIVKRISHWFKTLGNADWFGIKTIEKLVESGYDSLEKIYGMNESDFKSTGFGPVQAKNLAEAVDLTKNKAVEDWRFLAAFGVSDLGTGDSRKLLSHIKLEELLERKAEDIKKIHGFGEITSRSIERSIKQIKATLIHMLSMNFNLVKTPLTGETGKSASSIAGKGIVFTGKMESGSREEIKDAARRLGVKVQNSVGGKTDYLVCGEKGGASKINKARELGVRIISEREYLDIIVGGGD